MSSEVTPLLGCGTDNTNAHESVGVVSVGLSVNTECVSAKSNTNTDTDTNIRIHADTDIDCVHTETDVHSRTDADTGTHSVVENGCGAELVDMEIEVDIERPDEQVSKMGDLKAMMTIMKGNIGTGVLAMPYAISCAGLIVGPLGIAMMGGVAALCTHLLVRSCRTQINRSRLEGEEMEMTFATLLEWSLKTAHPSLRGWPATLGRYFVNSLLMISQLGFCGVYIVFIVENAKSTVDTVVPSGPPLWVYQLVTSVLLVLYCQIKNLKTLSPFSTIANIITVSCIGLVFMDFFKSPMPSVSARPAFAGWSQMPVFFGFAVYSFEGISLVLPLERQVKNKRQFSGTFGVLTLSMGLIVILYVAMGFFGFLVYGDQTQASITLNLPPQYNGDTSKAVSRDLVHRYWYYLLVKPGFAAVIFLSYNLQLYVPVKITVTWLTGRYRWHGEQRKTCRHVAEACVRVVFVLLTTLLAVVIPKLDLLISFVGAFASSFLAIVLPALIYLLTSLPHKLPHTHTHTLTNTHNNIHSYTHSNTSTNAHSNANTHNHTNIHTNHTQHQHPPSASLSTPTSTPSPTPTHTSCLRVVVIVFLVLIIVLGLLGFVMGTYTSVMDIIHSI